MPRSAAPRRVLHLVVFLAGFAFLVHEVCWHRLLALALGATVAASTLVLAVIMAGFGAGAALFGRSVDASPRPGRLLGRLLLGVGVSGALAAWLLTVLTGDPAAPLGAGPTALAAVLLLFAPSVLMGGVFPAASRCLAASGGSLGTVLGRLYAVETLGSALGGLAAGFLLLGALGQRGALGLAVALDVAAGLLALFIAGRVLQSAEAPVESVRRRFSLEPAVLRAPALVAAAVCGFSLLALQVLWIRMFRVYLTNTSYTFALVASLAVLGLFVGSDLYGRLAPRVKDPRVDLQRALLGLAVTAGLGLYLLLRLPELLMFPLQSALADPLARILLLPLVAGLLVVFPPAVCSGYVFPLACRMVADSGRVGRGVGLVLTVNTIGSVLGPVLATFVLLPRLGAVRATVLILALIVGAVLFTLRGLRGGAVLRPGLFVTAAILLAVVVLKPEVRILPPSFARFDRDVLFYRESVEGTVSVGRDRDTRTESKYTFVNNSAVIGSSYDAIKAVKMVGNLPFLAGLDGREVLVVGFGIGVTTSAIAAHPEVESIECIELVGGLRDAAAFYRELNGDVMADPRLHLRSGDGRHALRLADRRFDLISCDPTHPVLGSSALYTREWYELCRARLKPGGMLSQYLPLHKLGADEFLGLLATFHAVFPHGTVWLGHYHAVLLGATEPLQVDFADWSARVAALGIDPHTYLDPHHLAATLAFDPALLDELTAGRRINTDDRSYTEFFAPGCLDEGNLALNLRLFLEHKADLAAIFTNVDDPERLQRFVAGNRLLTESLVLGLEGGMREARATLERAVAANPEDQELPFLIRLNY
jgi:spermidine synthase